MHTRLKRVLVLVVGWAFLLLGIAGLFLPILQGILFMVVGLLILSSEYLWAHRVLGKLRARFPAVAHHAEEAASRAESWLKRISRRSSD